MSKGYAVVTQNNYDGDMRIVYFEDYDKAVAYLHWAWEDFLNTEIAECPDSIIEEDTYHENTYALISYKEGDVTEVFLNEIDSPFKEFNEVDWKRYL